MGEAHSFGVTGLLACRDILKGERAVLLTDRIR